MHLLIVKNSGEGEKLVGIFQIKVSNSLGSGKSTFFSNSDLPISSLLFLLIFVIVLGILKSIVL